MPIARIDKAAGTRLRLYPKPQGRVAQIVLIIEHSE
jgi:hypothetical protein